MITDCGLLKGTVKNYVAVAMPALWSKRLFELNQENLQYLVVRLSPMRVADNQHSADQLTR